MPVSDLHGFFPIMQEIQSLNPKRVLELGVGFGLYGVAVRQVLDAQHGRCRHNQWRAILHGVEVHERYQNPVWSAYDVMNVCNFLEYRPIVGWDLVMMIDSLEHVEPEHGRPFLAELVKDNRQVIISVPNGRMDQGAVFGNEYETHRWTFTDLDEFAPYDFKVLHRGVCTVVSIKGQA